MRAKTKKVGPKSSKQQLRLIATQWTLAGYPDPKKEWSWKRKLEAIQAAGFDGVAAGIDSPLLKLARDAGLEVLGGSDFGSKADAREKLQRFAKLGVQQINVQLCDHDTPIPTALPIAIEVIKLGEKFGVVPSIEAHRDTCTETPEKTYALADAYAKTTGKKLRMNFDHSHLAIIKHLAPSAYWPRLGVRLDLLALSSLLHMRPFNGHHCQIPITKSGGGLSPEYVDWLKFAAELLKAWRRLAPPDATCYIVPELGPRISGYALSCFPDVWKDAVQVGRDIRKLWAAAG